MLKSPNLGRLRASPDALQRAPAGRPIILHPPHGSAVGAGSIFSRVLSIAGQKAFVNYIVANPGQVNVQLPSNIPTGAQQITVTNKNGTSAPFNVTVNATEPGLLAPASFKIGGKQYVVAFHSDNVTYVLPEGAIAGLPSRPAKPVETIVMYGNGFGPVTPNIPDRKSVEYGKK